MDDTFLTFMDEPDSIDHCRENRPWKIMVVDDEKSIHDITTLSLKEFTFDGQGVEFINAYSAQQARAYLQATPDIALMLVDVVMESENAGLEFVRYFRNELKNSIVQVVIRTGQPGYAPEDRVISDYQINSYFSKTEVTSQKLVSLVTTSLRTYQLSLALQQALVKGKKAESDLRELNQDLEKRIEERTKQVSRANQLKSQFLANMSHEIRTPMNGIIGMANLLLDEPLTLKQKKVAGIIRSSGNTLLALINDILDLSKIEAGQLVFELKDFELNALVHEALALFKIKADQKGLKLIAHIDPALPSCLAGDPVRLKQILVNLLGNAVKFTSKGRVDLGVCLAKEFKAHILMNIEVKDTGPGIDKAFKARMFDTFSQADASTTRKYGGTGLGLAITRQLANMMDGHVDAWNRPGGGAVFKVGLKLKKYSGVPSLKDDDPFSKEAQSVLLEQIGKMDINIRGRSKFCVS
ncbi:MAG: hybrid sensor histidine kinase/response regulator [Desulfobacter sp.]|nr:MAG: hybrid sensor histidine kinase/response regulator [Desulfobacter sp.]